jgi:fibro-slime domain-containing protein
MQFRLTSSRLGLFALFGLCACGTSTGNPTGSGDPDPTVTDEAGARSTARDGGSSVIIGGGEAGIIVDPAGDAGADSGDGASALCGTTLMGVVRDFEDTHPDFEKFAGIDDKNIVMPQLGADQKPVYAGNPTTASTTGKTDFDQWYRDTPGINIPIPLSVTLSPNGPNTYSYDNEAFFPIDNQGFGNQGRNHNFHFTVEIHTRFIYRGGEVFNFRGDDDIFVFINGQLAINLGGVHNAESDQVDLDARASQLGMTKGGTYPLDLFFAERHTTESHIRMDTSIGAFVDCGHSPPPPN